METQVIIEPDKGSADSVVKWLTSIGVQANVNDVVDTPEGNRSLITSIPFSDLTGLSEIPGVLEIKSGPCPWQSSLQPPGVRKLRNYHELEVMLGQFKNQWDRGNGVWRMPGT